jgi:hypothetical protein
MAGMDQDALEEELWRLRGLDHDVEILRQRVAQLEEQNESLEQQKGNLDKECELWEQRGIREGAERQRLVDALAALKKENHQLRQELTMHRRKESLKHDYKFEIISTPKDSIFKQGGKPQKARR